MFSWNGSFLRFLPSVIKNEFFFTHIFYVLPWTDSASLVRLRILKYSDVTVSVPKNNSPVSFRSRLAICLKRTVSIFSDTSPSSLRALMSLIASSSFMIRVSILDTSEKLFSFVFQDFRLLSFIVSISHRWSVSRCSLSSSSFWVKNAIWLRTVMSSLV